MDKHRKARIPKLRFTESRGVGWHVTCCDPGTGTPRQHRFGISERAREEEALAAYHRWLGEHLNGGTPKPRPAREPMSPRAVEPAPSPTGSEPGSVMDIASGLTVLVRVTAWRKPQFQEPNDDSEQSHRTPGSAQR